MSRAAYIRGISLVFPEMWDTTNVDRSMYRMNREIEGRCGGIPHLAKDERDVGTRPSLGTSRLLLRSSRWSQKFIDIAFVDQ